MSKNVKIFSILIIMVGIIFFLQGHVEARSYTIDNMNINATVQKDGSVYIEQDITFKFNGEYNGIYIDIPYNFEDKEYENVIKDNQINETFYNGDGVEVNNVYLIDDGKKTAYRQISYAYNGTSGVYTTSENNGLYEIKVYSPSNNTTKTFKIDYLINNLCVKHNDISELYYNFIGGAWKVTIKNLNIDVYLPNNNNQEIKAWGHGPYDGQCTIIDNNHINFKVKNVKPGQYVAARVTFENNNIPSATKKSMINAKEKILLEEEKLAENEKEKNKFSIKVLIFAVLLLIYWIILVLIFEKDKRKMMLTIEEDELFKKYNPMIAGCIQGSRNILARDIIAVILNLIDKKNIILDLKNNVKGKDIYTYYITQNQEKEAEMDNIERYVYNWVFNGSGLVNLQKRLQEMPKEVNANQRFKQLNELVEKKLSDIRANESRVPKWLRVFNTILFILCLGVSLRHILYNGLNIYGNAKYEEILFMLPFLLLPMFPVVLGLICAILNVIVIIRHKINNTVQKITGQKIVTTTVSLFVLFSVIIAITYFLAPFKYLVVDEILICIASIIMLTDNLMLKNNPRMIEDYSRLNMLRDKIKNYSMMEDKDIEQVFLWDKYLAYAVSFGVAGKILKRMKSLNLDEDLLNIVNDDILKKYILTDYNMFYRYANLDVRFVRTFEKTTGKMIEAWGKVGSSGSRRRILRRRRIFWRRRTPEVAEEPFKK